MLSEPPYDPTVVAAVTRTVPTRREIVWTAVRAVVGAAALLWAYYLLPESMERTAGVMLRVAIVAVLVAVVLWWQLRAITTAALPILRAVDALAVTVTLMVVGFARLYLQISQRDPRTFNQVLDHTSALYFTLTTLTTVGYGDIHARTDGARIAVMIQMVFNVVVVGASVKLILATARRARAESSPR